MEKSNFKNKTGIHGYISNPGYEVSECEKRNQSHRSEEELKPKKLIIYILNEYYKT